MVSTLDQPVSREGFGGRALDCDSARDRDLCRRIARLVYLRGDEKWKSRRSRWANPVTSIMKFQQEKF